jgi:hypothetical protein
VIVENFFGRLGNKFEITDRRLALLESFYPVVFEICCALVNFDTRPRRGSPLRAADGSFYLRYLTLRREEWEEQEERERRRKGPPPWVRRHRGQPQGEGRPGGGDGAEPRPGKRPSKRTTPSTHRREASSGEGTPISPHSLPAHSHFDHHHHHHRHHSQNSIQYNSIQFNRFRFN